MNRTRSYRRHKGPGRCDIDKGQGVEGKGRVGDLAARCLRANICFLIGSSSKGEG